MTKLLGIIAVTILTARTGYCTSALESLQAQENTSGAEVTTPLPSKATQAATPFEEIKNLFDQGVPATKQDLTGWHAGRVADRANPGVLEAGLLVGTAVESPSFNGVNVDIFDCYRIKGCNSATPAFFENMDKRTVALVKLSFGYRLLDAVTFPSAEVVSIDYEPYAVTKSITTYRKAKGAIIKRYSSYDTDGQVSDESYSYYSVDVTPGI
ncbi:MAG: hypothetical protein WCW52_09450 [Elusimicrobiales bacterium]|jgi:hypothetical protein